MCRLTLTALFATGLAVAAPGPKDRERAALFQSKANDAVWSWTDERATAEYSAERCSVPMRMQGTDYLRATLTIGTDDKVITIEGHPGTTFVVHGTTLYHADYHRMSSGCVVVATSLETGKQLWKTRLKGLGPIGHSKYRNAVALDMDDGALRVVGKESSGRYIEFVDRASGRTIGHKVFPDN